MCRKYLDALNEGCLEKVLSLFENNALVDSPLYGEIPATKFFTDLFADSSRSETSLLNIFESVSDDSSVALHFHYSWTLKNGRTVEFEVVDVFELALETGKFAKLKIIYDTAPIRDDFNKSQTSNYSW